MARKDCLRFAWERYDTFPCRFLVKGLSETARDPGERVLEPVCCFLRCVALKKAFWLSLNASLTSESVQGTSLSFQGVDDVHGGDSLPLGVLGVGDSIPDHVLQEDLQNSSGFFVDESRDTLDTTSASQSADGWLRDSLDVVS